MESEKLLISSARGNNFDAIRFLLASSVILCHSYVICLGYERFLETEPFMVLSQKQISLGSFAVDIFFIISGFLVAKSFENSSGSFEYLKKRVLRIFPGFIIAMVGSFLVVGFIGSGKSFNFSGFFSYIDSLQLKRELIHILTLQKPFQREFFNGLPEPGLNDSVWTIHYEFISYLLLPVLAIAGLFRKKTTILVVFILCYLLLFLQTWGIIFPYNDQARTLIIDNPYYYPRFFTYFLSGTCFYIYRDVIKRNHILALVSFVAVALSFTWIRCVDQVLPVAGTYFLFYAAYHPTVKLNNFAKYGDFSYGIYLYGWPVQMVVMYYLKDSINPYVLFLVAFPLATLLAFLSWHLIEQPFLRLKRVSSRLI